MARTKIDKTLVPDLFPFSGGTLTGPLALPTGTSSAASVQMTGAARTGLYFYGAYPTEQAWFSCRSVDIWGTNSSNFEVRVPLVAKGTTTNDSAAAGYIGEYIELVTSTSQNFPTSTQYGDLNGGAADISLTAGDWDVTVTFRTNLNSSTCTDVSCGISITSGNSTTGLVSGSNLFLMAPPTSSYGTNMGFVYRVSLASTTTVYLKYMANYSAGTPQARGRISARRVR